MKAVRATPPLCARRGGAAAARRGVIRPLGQDRLEDLLGRRQAAEVALAVAHGQRGAGDEPRLVAGVGEGNEVIGVPVPEADRHADVPPAPARGTPLPRRSAPAACWAVR